MKSNADEYLRRNLLVAKAYGVRGNLRSAYERMKLLKRRPVTAMKLMMGALERIEPCVVELAKHRDEVKP